MTLYVYFKLIVAEHPNLFAIIRGMQNQLSIEYPGLKTRLLKRPNADEEGRETWMEVYDINPAVQSQFMGRISELAVAGKLPHPRRNEFFISID